MRNVTESLGSRTARGGYSEEENQCKLFNGDSVYRDGVRKTFEIDGGEIARRVKGTTKTDIHVGKRAQHKKTIAGRFGQVDRHSVGHLIEHNPALKPDTSLLKMLCEYPAVKDSSGKLKVVVPGDRPKLKEPYVKGSRVEKLVRRLENPDTKRRLLEYAFLGTDPTTAPELFVITVYECGEPKCVRIWTMEEVIGHIEKSPVRIRASGTVIEIGKLFTIQRKGGDSGSPGSNDIACKFIPTGLPVSFEYRLD